MKKISPKDYAHALLVSLEKSGADKERTVKNFITAIRAHSDWARRKEIVDAFEKAWFKKQGKSIVSIESARPLTKTQETNLQKQWAGAEIRYAINQSLVAGVRIVVDEERQFNGSLARKLRTLFRGEER